ncbi:raftlin [Hylobates moloch]|uniref:raftlin n=1 Tax=Hylobates moloch TaxID=81572 RepID=UPI0026773BAD|nr:raftlin [Hylobates moloch]
MEVTGGLWGAAHGEAVQKLESEWRWSRNPSPKSFLNAQILPAGHTSAVGSLCVLCYVVTDRGRSYPIELSMMMDMFYSCTVHGVITSRKWLIQEAASQGLKFVGVIPQYHSSVNSAGSSAPVSTANSTEDARDAKNARGDHASLENEKPGTGDVCSAPAGRNQSPEPGSGPRGEVPIAKQPSSPSGEEDGGELSPQGVSKTLDGPESDPLGVHEEPLSGKMEIFTLFNKPKSHQKCRQYYPVTIPLRVSKNGQTVSGLDANWLEHMSDHFRKGGMLVNAVFYLGIVNDSLHGLTDGVFIFEAVSTEDSKTIQGYDAIVVEQWTVLEVSVGLAAPLLLFRQQLFYPPARSDRGAVAQLWLSSERELTCQNFPPASSLAAATCSGVLKCVWIVAVAGHRDDGLLDQNQSSCSPMGQAALVSLSKALLLSSRSLPYFKQQEPQVPLRRSSSMTEECIKWLILSSVCYSEGSVSTKQIVFLQRPCLPQKIKKKESKFQWRFSREEMHNRQMRKSKGKLSARDKQQAEENEKNLEDQSSKAGDMGNCVSGQQQEGGVSEEMKGPVQEDKGEQLSPGGGLCGVGVEGEAVQNGPASHSRALGGVCTGHSNPGEDARDGDAEEVRELGTVEEN